MSASIGMRNHHRAPPPGVSSTVELAADRPRRIPWRRRARVRRPRRWACRRAAGTAGRRARDRSTGMPGPSSMTRRCDLVAHRRRLDPHRHARRVRSDSALSMRLATARSSRVGST